MNKQLLEEFKKQLEENKESLENELGKFAKKDEKMKGDWDTKFPRSDAGSSGSSALESAADDVEEYSNSLAIEHSLEIKLQNIELALEKIKKGTYGICENCNKEIPIERLKIAPEARICLDCEKK